MAGRLQDKVALVTGAGSGFGEGIAKCFAAEGAKTVVADIDAENGQRVTDEIVTANGIATFVAADVANSAASRAMFDATRDAYGNLDISVLNAAIGMNPCPLAETEDEFFDHIFHINVRSVFLGLKHSVHAMEGKGGSIIVTVSTAAIRPRPNLAVYNSTKGALVPMCKALALEVADQGIRVNGICPVAGETPMLEVFLGDADPVDGRTTFKNTVPLGRLSTPVDIANAALFFAEDESSLVTGTMLEIDGGRCI